MDGPGNPVGKVSIPVVHSSQDQTKALAVHPESPASPVYFIRDTVRFQIPFSIWHQKERFPIWRDQKANSPWTADSPQRGYINKNLAASKIE